MSKENINYQVDYDPDNDPHFTHTGNPKPLVPVIDDPPPNINDPKPVTATSNKTNTLLVAGIAALVLFWDDIF